MKKKYLILLKKQFQYFFEYYLLKKKQYIYTKTNKSPVMTTCFPYLLKLWF